LYITVGFRIFRMHGNMALLKSKGILCRHYHEIILHIAMISQYCLLGRIYVIHGNIDIS
jgi:hypothetical protein